MQMLQPNSSISPLTLNFQELRESARILPDVYQKHAFQIFDQIEGLNTQIKAQVSQYQKGNTAMRPAIAATVDHILKSLISPSYFPKDFNQTARHGLQGIFSPIGDECNRLRSELFKAEQENRDQKIAFNKAKNDQLSLVLNKEQKLFTSHLPPLKAFLEKLAEKIAGPNTPPSVYIAYAWPTEERINQEDWVQGFLANLQSHLKLGGLNTVRLDFVSNRYGNNINEYMKQARTDDYVLLFGTESLKEKHDIGLSALCTEMIEILRKREIDLKKKMRRVFPIMISGNLRDSFPPEYERYTTVRDWRQSNYLAHLQMLYLELFDLSPEDYLAEIQQWWETALKSFPEQAASIKQELGNYKNIKKAISKAPTIEELQQINIEP